MNGDIELVPPGALDGYRRSLDKARAHQIRAVTNKLASAWRPVSDDRENLAELVHSNTGDRVDERSFHGKDENIHSLASWAVEQANAHCTQLDFGTPQRYDLIFNGTPVQFWVTPRHGAADGQMLEMTLSRVFDHQESMLGQYFEDKAHTQGAYKDLLEILKEENKSLRAMLETSNSQHIESAKVVGELYRNKHLQELEIKKLDKEQERWDKAADTTLGYIGMGINEAIKDFQSKKAKARGDVELDEATIMRSLAVVESMLEKDEAELLGMLLRRIKARNEEAAKAAAKGGTKVEKPAAEPAKEPAGAAGPVVTPERAQEPPRVEAPSSEPTKEPPKPEPEGAK
jgi:hypothetical protein